MSTMRAVLYQQYGSPDVLQLVNLAKPTPTANEVRVKIHASTVSATDSHYRRADPFITRFMHGLLRPNVIPGGLFAGEVDAVGSAVTTFKVGDAVFGASMNGANAEYLCLPEDGVLVTKPAGLSDADAAGIAEALTPLYFLRELAHLQAGQHILINGASGALGTFAVQLARYFGAEVTGVCSTANVELVKTLGAHDVIDYTQADFTQNVATYDVIFDAVAKSSFARCQNALKTGGLYMTVAFSAGIIRDLLWTSRISSKNAIIGFAGLNFNQADLAFLKTLVEAGALKSVNDRCYPLEQIVDAHRYVDSGRKKGNVVLQVMQPAAQ